MLLMLATAVAGVGLSFMRDAHKDETIYLREAAIMADCLREGAWFGNEAVGLHGFIAKIPAALLFLAFGKSVFAATFVTVLMAVVCCKLCFDLLRKIVASDRWALAGTVLMLANFQFLRLLPTFNRDIPVLLALLWFLRAVLAGRNRWVIGMLLLLILDCKEYLFFMILPAFAFWVILDERGQAGGRPAGKTCPVILARWTAAVLPALLYLVLMFGTGVVPLNMFAGRILGMTETYPSTTTLAQFSPSRSTENLWQKGRHLGGDAVSPEAEKEPGRSAPTRKDAPPPTTGTARIRNLALRYAGKIFYPSLFSFDGIPKVMALPALVMSVVLFRKWRRKKQSRLQFLCLLVWVILVFFMLIPSYPRYLFPIFPILIGFFLLFLRDGLTRPRCALVVLLSTAVFAYVGLYFNSAGLLKKITVNTMVLASMVTVYAAQRGNGRLANMLPFGTVGLIAAICIASILRHNLANPWGQIGNFMRFGYNRECSRVLAQFAPDERFWLNDAGWKHLLDFRRGERPLTAEWQGQLKPWVPKKALLRRFEDRKAHDFWWMGFADFRNRIRQNRIERVGLVVSNVDDRRFPYQRHLDEFVRKPWLEPERTVEFRNKTLYVFRYIEM
jgi:hypothetical protein